MSHCCGGRLAGQRLELTFQGTPHGTVNIADLHGELKRIAQTLKEAYDESPENGKIRSACIAFGDEKFDIPRFAGAIEIVLPILHAAADAAQAHGTRRAIGLSHDAPSTLDAVNIDELITVIKTDVAATVPRETLTIVLNTLSLAALWTSLANRVAKIKSKDPDAFKRT